MSYIVDDKTINKVVSYLYAKAKGPDSTAYPALDKMGYNLINPVDLKRLAHAMFNLNVDAIQARYGEADGEGFPLPSFTYVFTPATQIEVIKAVECWKYQCTEGELPSTFLYKAMKQTLSLLCSDYIHQLDEYEATPWG